MLLESYLNFDLNFSPIWLPWQLFESFMLSFVLFFFVLWFLLILLVKCISTGWYVPWGVLKASVKQVCRFFDVISGRNVHSRNCICGFHLGSVPNLNIQRFSIMNASTLSFLLMAFLIKYLPYYTNKHRFRSSIWLQLAETSHSFFMKNSLLWFTPILLRPALILFPSISNSSNSLHSIPAFPSYIYTPNKISKLILNIEALDCHNRLFSTDWCTIFLIFFFWNNKARSWRYT